MPLPDAGIGLPRYGPNISRHAAFAIERAHSLRAVIPGFAGVNGLSRSAHIHSTDIVKLGYARESILLEGNAAIGVQKVGLIAVDEVLDAMEIFDLPTVGRDAAHRLCRL